MRSADMVARGPGGGSRREWVDARLRPLIADHLGVDVSVLVPGTSLVDDLAADSLDLAELSLVLESEFGVTLPQRAVEELRTYEDIVGLLLASATRRRPPRAVPLVPVLARVRIVPPAERRSVPLERLTSLTPYAVELLVEDALRAGRGASVEIDLPTDTEALNVTAAETRFAWLAARGITVRIRRGLHPGHTAAA
jgi:acyl carrier protein